MLKHYQVELTTAQIWHTAMHKGMYKKPYETTIFSYLTTNVA